MLSSLLQSVSLFFICLLFSIGSASMLAGQQTDSVFDASWHLQKSLSLPYSQLDSSILLVKKAISLANRENAKVRFRAHELLATFFLEKGEMDSSLMQAFRSLEVAQNSSSDSLLAEAYNTLEAVYFEMGQIDQSKKYADKLLDLAEEKGLEQYRFEAYWALGMIHSRLYNDSLLSLSKREENYEKSRDYYQKALSEESIGRLDSIDILSSLGILEADRGNYEKATAYLQKVAKQYEEEGSVVGLANVHNNLGYTFFEMGEVQKALAHLNEAWNIVKDLPLWIERAYIAESLQEVHDHTGNSEQAYYFLKQHVEAEDRLSTNRLEADLDLIESQYQNRVLAAENAKRAQQVENQYLLIVLGIILVFSLVIILGILYYAKKRQDELIKTIQTNNDELQKLNQFKDQILSVISHDFNSPLNNLQTAISLAREDDLSAEEYKSILQGVDGQLASTQIFLQNILYWARNQIKGYKVVKTEFSLDDLVEESEGLLSQQIENKNLSIKKNYDASMDLFSDREIINIVFRNILQNAIKYSKDGETVAINYYKKNEDRIISVIDSGVGMEKEVIDKLFTHQIDSMIGTQLENGAGIGLILSRELLELIDGKIEVFSVKNQGSEFQIILS